MPLRLQPRVGDDVTVVFLDAQVRGSIEHVSRDGHELEVLAEDGELIAFRLNRATARFQGAGAHLGARLLFG